MFLLYLNFLSMKILISMIIASLAIVSTVSAATGSTSTGSTSTWSTSTGVVSTGSISLPSSVKWSGGPIRAFNVTTQQFELFPQCFPYTYLFYFYQGNLSMIYENQKICREKRAIDFAF